MKREPSSKVQHELLGLFLRLFQAINSLLIIPLGYYGASENLSMNIEDKFPIIISYLTLIYFTLFVTLSIFKPGYLVPGAICFLEFSFFVLWLTSFAIVMNRGGFSSCSPIYVYFVGMESFHGIRDNMSPCHAHNAATFLSCLGPIYFMISMGWYLFKNFRAAMIEDTKTYLFSMHNPKRYWLSWLCFINSPLGVPEDEKEANSKLLEAEDI